MPQSGAALPAQPKDDSLSSEDGLNNLTQTIALLAFFTFFWAGIMIAWAIVDRPVPLAVPFAAFAVFAAGGVWLGVCARSSQRRVADLFGTGDKPSPSGKKSGERTSKPKPDAAARRWTAIFVIQGVAIGAAACALSIFGQFRYIAPATLLIVGLHFIPIGLIYKTAIQQYWAAALIITACVAIFMLLAGGKAADFASPLCGVMGALSTITLGAWANHTIRRAIS
jgi:hypothetical protein